METEPNAASGICSDPMATDRDPASRIRILLLVSSLERGGAERQVIHLANHLDPDRFDVHVCSLSSQNPLADGLRERERRLHIVEKRWRFDAGPVWGVARLMRNLGIDLVHAFLFDAEMAARIGGRLAGVSVVLGSERNTDYRIPGTHWICKRATRGMIDGLIANSEAGRRFNIERYGMAAERIHVIHNGVDTQRFRPEARDRTHEGPQPTAASSRRKLGLQPNNPVVGMVASFKPQKNHAMLLGVAQRVMQEQPDAQFVCVGEHLQGWSKGRGVFKTGAGGHGDTLAYHREIVDSIRQLGLEQRVIIAGIQEDMPDVYRSFDVSVLTSRHEGTPNVLLESMACEVPVVATDVADNARLVPEGRVGHIVPLDDADAMARRLLWLLGNPRRRQEMGRAAREWVCCEYSLEALARKTAGVYERILATKLNGQRVGGDAARGA